ncbi:MAG: sulfate adenylyltransferase, partial [Verrucomicrobia bacterium]
MFTNLDASITHSHLIPPHGGELVNLNVDAERAAELKAQSRDFPSWDLTARHIRDLELLLNGAFSPLGGFMTMADYEGVCHNMRLTSGVLWPIPITLDVSESFAKTLKPGSSKIALRDAEGVMLAVLHVEEVWQPDREAEAKAVFNTTSPIHPGVNYLLNKENPWYVGGRIEGLQPPAHYDFKDLRLTPAELRVEFARLGWRRVVAFQTRNPMHRAHVELTLRAAKQVEANLLIHPAVGVTKLGDVDYFTRVRCYQRLITKYPHGTAKLSLLPLAMRLGGPREAIWHALIRKNHGCTHLIVGRDHAGPGKDADGKPFYGPYEAQELFKKHEADIGVSMVPFNMMVYVEDEDKYFPEGEVPKDKHVLHLSGTELRQRLNEGRDIPAWFTYPDVVQELRRSFPPRHKQGLTVFFTGLSG